jgi:hypothetical protein
VNDTNAEARDFRKTATKFTVDMSAIGQTAMMAGAAVGGLATIFK